MVDLDEDKLIVELVNCALVRMTSCECRKATKAATSLALVSITKADSSVQTEPVPMENTGRILRGHRKGSEILQPNNLKRTSRPLCLSGPQHIRTGGQQNESLEYESVENFPPHVRS